MMSHHCLTIVYMNIFFNVCLVIIKLWTNRVDICTDNQLYLLNERTLGDFKGMFTCHTPRSSSVVDYFKASRSLSNDNFSMNVHDVTLFFDHFC